MPADLTPPAGFRVVHPLRVRYNECDMQGVVFNANYLTYADIGITEYIRALTGGGSWAALFGGLGGDSMVRHADIDFRAPARADEMLALAVRTTRFGGRSYVVETHILRDAELLAVVTLTYVFVDLELMKARPLPQTFVDAITAFEAVTPDGPPPPRA